MAESLFDCFNQTRCNHSTASLPLQETLEFLHISEIVSKEVAVILSVIFALVSALGTLGNSLILLAVITNINLRRVPDLFITSLAISDLSVCVVYLPMVIYDHNYKFQDDEQFKNFNIIKSFFGHISTVASATNIFAMTVDRVCAIRFPFQYVAVLTAGKAILGIAFVWIISLIFAILYGSPVLIPRFYASIYISSLLITTIIVYVYIFIAAKRQENRIHNIHPGSGNTMTEKKVTKTILTVVGVYTLCWMPLLLLPGIFHPSTKFVLFKKAFSWAQTLVACNSAVNPLIYCMRSSKYRREFAKLLRI
ncbi:melanocortin receptor 3-like [Stylophora pistillata]|uniref:melanocortin receptor 3-like n=1 Tax=Stylophora pistillata TaxID=50429 RepID=UPI000C0508DE|nr:melanocortin receptor 3-like [Stylophora pistillata]